MALSRKFFRQLPPEIPREIPVGVMVAAVATFFAQGLPGWSLGKCLVFGALGSAVFHALRRLSVERSVAYLSLALFALSTSSLAAVLGVGDLSVFSQLAVIVILLWAVPEIEKGPPTPRFMGILIGVLLLGSKFLGEVRIVPLVLLGWLYLYRRERFGPLAVPLGASFMASLGLAFIEGPGPSLNLFSLGRVLDFPVLGALGIGIAALALAYGAYRILLHFGVRRGAPGPVSLRSFFDEDWGLLLFWLGLALVASGFEKRHALGALVPAIILVGMAGQSAVRQASRKGNWLKPVLLVVVAAQCGLHLFHDYRYRRELGQLLIPVEELRRVIGERYSDQVFAAGPGFPPAPGQITLGSLEEASQLPAGKALVASWTAPLDARFSVEHVATGCGASLFDLLFRCPPHQGAVLLRYVGAVSEVNAADQLEKKGNLAAARRVLEEYLRKAPGNLGVSFMLSLYAYRQGDFARMEALYDQLGPYFPSHPSVLYNWGRAKQGLEKYGEAAALLEKAYALLPKDFAIGFNLADTYHKQGQTKRALATLGELMKSHPESVSLKNAFNDWSK